MSIEQLFLTHMGELENLIHAGKASEAIAKCMELRNDFSGIISHLRQRPRPEAPTSTGREWML
jgi:hypothetical protein